MPKLPQPPAPAYRAALWATKLPAAGRWSQQADETRRPRTGRWPAEPRVFQEYLMRRQRLHRRRRQFQLQPSGTDEKPTRRAMNYRRPATISRKLLSPAAAAKREDVIIIVAMEAQRDTSSRRRRRRRGINLMKSLGQQLDQQQENCIMIQQQCARLVASAI